MINTNMRYYDYFQYGEQDDYGQPKLSNKKGSIKMNINLSSQMIQDSILYAEAAYVGITHDNAIDDTYVIQFGDEKLKVLYVNRLGRLNQVFMSKMP